MDAQRTQQGEIVMKEDENTSDEIKNEKESNETHIKKQDPNETEIKSETPGFPPGRAVQYRPEFGVPRRPVSDAHVHVAFSTRVFLQHQPTQPGLRGNRTTAAPSY